MIACCGLSCAECPAYLATRNDDQEARVRTAEKWTEFFERRVDPEEINCDGCLTEGRWLFSHCSTCSIRTCCRESGYANCAHCPDYPCANLVEFQNQVPEAKEGLERIRRSRPG